MSRKETAGSRLHGRGSRGCDSGGYTRGLGGVCETFMIVDAVGGWFVLSSGRFIVNEFVGTNSLYQVTKVL